MAMRCDSMHCNATQFNAMRCNYSPTCVDTGTWHVWVRIAGFHINSKCPRRFYTSPMQQHTNIRKDCNNTNKYLNALQKHKYFNTLQQHKYFKTLQQHKQIFECTAITQMQRIAVDWTRWRWFELCNTRNINPFCVCVCIGSRGNEDVKRTGETDRDLVDGELWGQQNVSAGIG